MPAGQRQCTRPRSLAPGVLYRDRPHAGRAWRDSGVVPPSAPPVLTPPQFGSKHAARRSRRGAPRQPAHVQPQAVEAAGGAGSGGVCVLSASGAGCERGGSRPPARTLSARRAAGEAQAGPRAPAPLRTESGACDQADTARTFCAHWHPAYGEQHDRSRSMRLEDAWRPPDRGHRAPIARQIYAQCRPGVSLLVVSVRWQMRH